MRAFACVFLGSALISSAAIAADPPAAQSSVKPVAATGDQKVICKSEPVLGSMVRRMKTCRTAAEWRDVHNQTRDITERAQDRGAQ